MLVDKSVFQGEMWIISQASIFFKTLVCFFFFFSWKYRMLHAIAEKKDVRLYIRYEELLQENTGEILFVWLIFQKVLSFYLFSFHYSFL